MVQLSTPIICRMLEIICGVVCRRKNHKIKWTVFPLCLHCFFSHQSKTILNYFQQPRTHSHFVKAELIQTFKTSILI